MSNESESFERLLVSLIKMIGKSNEKIDDLAKRVHQLETAAKEQPYNRVFSFITEPPKPNSQKEYSSI